MHECSLFIQEPVSHCVMFFRQLTMQGFIARTFLCLSALLILTYISNPSL